MPTHKWSHTSTVSHTTSKDKESYVRCTIAHNHFCFHFSWLRALEFMLKNCRICDVNNADTALATLEWSLHYPQKENHKVMYVIRHFSTDNWVKNSPVGISYNFHLTVGGSDVDFLASWNWRCRSSFDHHHIFIQCACHTQTHTENNSDYSSNQTKSNLICCRVQNI